MAIGVSYRGHDGRTQTFTTDGNPAAGSALDQIVRGKTTGSFGNLQSPMADLMRRSHKAVAPDPRIDRAAGSVKLDPMDQRPGTLKDKLDPSGSIDAGMRGLRLKGDDSTANNVVYGRHAGQSKFVTLDEIDDPTIKGQVIGATGSSTSVDSDGNVSSNSTEESGDEAKDGPYRVNLQSRMEATVDKDEGKVTLYEFTKPIDVTAGKRVGMIGAETKREVCSFFLGSGGGGGFAPCLLEVFQGVTEDSSGNKTYDYWAFCPKYDNGDIQDAGFYFNGDSYSGEGSEMYAGSKSGIVKVGGVYVQFMNRDGAVFNNYSTVYLGSNNTLGENFSLYGCLYHHKGDGHLAQAMVTYSKVSGVSGLESYIKSRRGYLRWNIKSVEFSDEIARVENNKLTIVNTAKVLVGSCAVTFIDKKGVVVSQQTVGYGESASDPNPGTEWNCDFSRVVKDMVITPKTGKEED